MDDRTDLFERIRIKPHAEEREAQKPSVSAPPCEHPGCLELGLYKAPKGRHMEGAYYRFCVDHVREYNRTYDYFRGMKEDEVVNFQRDAITGHRPTWGMGLNGSATKKKARLNKGGPHFYDPFEVMEEAGLRPFDRQKVAPKITPEERKAFATLGCDENDSSENIKSAYKSLVKKHHPDANGGRKENEDKLREIIDAYNVLKKGERV